MNKQELVAQFMERTGMIVKAQAERHVNAVIDIIKETVAEGDSVQLVGFGTFGSKERAARTARNPQTGGTVAIAAKKVPTFKAGKAFKEIVNK